MIVLVSGTDPEVRGRLASLIRSATLGTVFEGMDISILETEAEIVLEHPEANHSRAEFKGGVSRRIPTAQDHGAPVIYDKAHIPEGYHRLDLPGTKCKCPLGITGNDGYGYCRNVPGVGCRPPEPTVLFRFIRGGCGKTEAEARRDGCPRGPCPMEPVT